MLARDLLHFICKLSSLSIRSSVDWSFGNARTSRMLSTITFYLLRCMVTDFQWFVGVLFSCHQNNTAQEKRYALPLVNLKTEKRCIGRNFTFTIVKSFILQEGSLIIFFIRSQYTNVCPSENYNLCLFSYLPFSVYEISTFESH